MNTVGSKQKLFLCCVSCTAVVLSLMLAASSFAYEKEINALSAAMAEKIVRADRTSVAVVDFTDLEGNVTQLGRFIAEEFSTALAGAGKGFKVVDRTHLNSIVKENKLSVTGLIDPETARKLGQIIGVQALITGTLTPFGDTVRVAVKVLDTATAEIIDAIRGNIAKTEAVNTLLTTSLTLGSPPVPPEGKQGEFLQTIEARGFSFHLVSSKISNGTVIFSLLINSLEKSKELGMFKSRFIDSEGNEYKGNEVKIGSHSHWGHVSSDLIADIPVKASLTFNGVSQKIKRVALLDVHCSGFNVQFRNILLSNRTK
ncbi:hypothetical protein KKHLCK_07230 [Candidatus Electrothrix laxa]